MAEETGRQKLEETLDNINTYLSNLVSQNEQRYTKDDEKEKRREEWEAKLGEKNISKNNQYLSRAIKSELNGLGKDIGNEIANSLPPALKELTSSITNSLSKSFSTYNKIMDAADKDRQKQLEKLKKDFINNGNKNMPQSILDILGGGSSGGSTGTTGSGGGRGGTPTSKVKMGDFDPEDAAGASKLGKLLPDIPGLGGLIGGAAKFAGPIALAGAGIQIGKAVNKFQKQMAESGAITGQGRTAGVGAAVQAFKMGANPFDLLSAQFAQQITDTFRSAGFKDGLAYSLSDSFGSVTKTMGESLSKDLLPVATDFASALRASGSTFKEIKDKMDSFDESIISMYKVTKLTSSSTHDLNAGFSTLAMNIVKMGGVTDDTGQVVSEFISRMFTPTPEGGGVSGGQGLVGVGGIGAEQVAQMVTQAAPYLAGRLGIAAPLAFVGPNARKVTNELTNVFKSLYDAAPAMFKTDQGLPQYAAYLLAGFLPGIGMGNFTVDQVVALLRSSGGSGGGGTSAGSYSQFMKNVGIGDIGNGLSDILTGLGKSNVSKQILQNSEKLQDSEAMKQFRAKGGTEQDLVDYAEQKQEEMGRGSLKSYMRSVLLKRNLQSSIDVTDKQKESTGSELDAVKSASSVEDQTGMSNWATDHIKELMSQLDKTGDVYKQLMNAPSKGLQGLEKAIDITLTLSPTASDQDLISKFFKALQVEAYRQGAPVL